MPLDSRTLIALLEKIERDPAFLGTAAESALYTKYRDERSIAVTTANRLNEMAEERAKVRAQHGEAMVRAKQLGELIGEAVEARLAGAKKDILVELGLKPAEKPAAAPVEKPTHAEKRAAKEAKKKP